MNYQLTNGSSIIRLGDNAFIPVDPANADYQAYLSWVAMGNVAQPATQPTLSQVIASLEIAVQLWLDQTAQGNGYNDIHSCISYLNSSNSTWAADAKAALAWRDAVWEQCYSLESSSALQSNPPTASQLIAQLPQPSAYGWTSHAPGA